MTNRPAPFIPTVTGYPVGNPLNPTHTAAG
jgi:hypothetical protein